MSKSTLSITIPNLPISGLAPYRAVHVPCRLPEAFNFKAAGKTYTAILKGGTANVSVEQVDFDGFTPQDEEFNEAGATAEAILEDAKRRLGLLPMEGRGPVLQFIALAYEAECESHNAQFKALQALPRELQNPGLVSTHPSERETYAGGAVGMLAKYVEWVLEQACKAQSDRAESQAKVTP